jgi:Zn-dependent protease with chaperone function
MRKFCWLLAPALGLAQLQQLQPGWNLFSPQQDVQLGKEASIEVERQRALVRNHELEDYLITILRKLEQSPYARTLNPDGSRNELFPFRIHVIYDKTVNAFALPGGPIFIHTGLIEAAENEAQLAGVIGHEMSHVVLRHSTNQASKQNLVALPALLAGALVGNSMLGQLAKIGLSFGANSVFLKFSRTNETEADYNGAQMVADAGYDPRQLAVFFERLEAKHGRESELMQFLSDHPNPGNRVAAVNEEARYLPRRAYVEDETGRFHAMQAIVHQLPAPALREADVEERREPSIPGARPSSRLIDYRGHSFSIAYPENWKVFGNRQSNAITIAPRDGVLQNADEKTQIGYGLEASYYHPKVAGVDLNRDTEALARQLKQANDGMRTGREARPIQVGDQTALLTTLYATSPYRGEREVDALVTVARPEGLFYAIFIAPQSEFDSVQKIFEEMLRSVRFF